MQKDKPIPSRSLKSAEEKEFAARLLDKIKIVKKSGQDQATDFVDPHLLQLGELLLSEHPDLEWEMDGGNGQAERKRIIISQAGVEYSELVDYVVLLSYQGSCPPKEYSGKKITHRDFLGAVIGTGIKRDKIGDIWPVECGCVMTAAKEVVAYLLQQPLVVKGVAMNPSVIPREDFKSEEKNGRVIEATVASLRLDALAAAGFGVSRSKLTKDILAGRFKVNWQERTQPDFQLAQGDVISCRGRGRAILQEVRGHTKKGRIKVTILRLG